MDKSKFEISAMIEEVKTGFRVFMAICFWVWGSVGLVSGIGAFVGLGTTISVGTSAYMAASSLMWIGGMIFFGMLGLMSRSVYEFKRPSN